MIMAMEGRSRKLDRRDWPAFLNRIVPQGVWQSLSRSSKQSKGDPPSRDDPRIRWSRKFVVLGFLEPVVARVPLASAQARLRELLDAKWDAGMGGGSEAAA